MPTKRQAKAYHRQLCRKLGIQAAAVWVVDEDTLDGDMGAYSHDLNLIMVRREDVVPSTQYKPRNWRWIIRHETHHHWMNQRGLLTATHYRGKLKSSFQDRPYSRRPWEVAADRFADKHAD